MNLEEFPETIRNLAEIIGLPATLAIVAVRGGTRIYIPIKSTPDHWLISIVGKDAFAELTKNYQGELIEIPRCAHSRKLAIEQEIAEAARAGAGTRELALRFGYTECGIRLLLTRVAKRNVLTQGDTP